MILFNAGQRSPSDADSPLSSAALLTSNSSNRRTRASHPVRVNTATGEKERIDIDGESSQWNIRSYPALDFAHEPNRPARDMRISWSRSVGWNRAENSM